MGMGEETFSSWVSLPRLGFGSSRFSVAAGFFVVLEVFFGGGGGVSSFLRLRWLVVRSSSTLSNRLVSSRTRNEVSLDGGSENFGDS